MSEGNFLAKLAEIARVDVGELAETTEITPVEWDSVEVLDLIAAIDESFGVTVAIEAMNKCRTVGDLRALIAAAGQK